MNSSGVPNNIDEYIDCCPLPVQERLHKIKSIISKAAPEAKEKLSYGMPAFTLNGMLLYFAAHTKHIGLYPFTTAIVAFREELSDYKTAKGSIQFPHDKPLPLKLIKDIVAFRVEENKTKASLKASLKKRRNKKL